VIIVHVPSLNERREDVPFLVNYYIEKIADEYGQSKKIIDKDAMELLTNYNWTGNIRELRNVVERLIILSGKNITADDVMNYVLPRK
ncbi:MAG: sigma-54-dependent Fis family transcriptional regulator, partial [Ferruginibacter sp.]|nr:sigma-54-dependent Fis family transcriptional regulator [Ferruginibacter sp.]